MGAGGLVGAGSVCKGDEGLGAGSVCVGDGESWVLVRGEVV